MIKKALSKTNKYLKKASTCRSMITRTVSTSTAIEGVHITDVAKSSIPKRAANTEFRGHVRMALT